MNIAIINLKSILKNLIKLILIMLCFILLGKYLIGKIYILEEMFAFKNSSLLYTSLFRTVNNEKNELNISNIIIRSFYPFLNAVENKDVIEADIKREDKKEERIEISKNVNTESVTEKNIAENYNITYSNVKIKNQSNYNLTDDVFSQDDLNLINNKKILIYHTHTCESYTPSENYNYQMTGNYRTTDKNYNVVRLRRWIRNVT